MKQCCKRATDYPKTTMPISDEAASVPLCLPTEVPIGTSAPPEWELREVRVPRVGGSTPCLCMTPTPGRPIAEYCILAVLAAHRRSRELRAAQCLKVSHFLSITLPLQPPLTRMSIVETILVLGTR